jgi:hypothetical protein
VSDIQQDDGLHDADLLQSAVTKPAVGFFDLASNLSEGMSIFVRVIYDAHSLKAFATLRLYLIAPPGNV